MKNEERFSSKADVYSKYRPSYPDAFINYLYGEVCFKSESIIADIGSGTGKLTEQLLKQGSFVYGVEPNDDIRNAADKLLSSYIKYKSIASAAEDTGLSSESIDFITVAQAFHWFDPVRFKTECQRILKKNGKVVLVRNERNMKSKMVCENLEINNKYSVYVMQNTKNPYAGKSIQEADCYKTGAYEYKEFENIIEMNDEVFIGWNLSNSNAPNENDASGALYISELKKLFHKYQCEGYVSMPFITQCYVGDVN